MNERLAVWQARSTHHGRQESKEVELERTQDPRQYLPHLPTLTYPLPLPTLNPIPLTDSTIRKL